MSQYNFDHPNAMDQAAIMQCLVNLKARVPVEVPVYDFVTHRRVCVTLLWERCWRLDAPCASLPRLLHRSFDGSNPPSAIVPITPPPRSRSDKTQTVFPADVIIFEGIMAREQHANAQSRSSSPIPLPSDARNGRRPRPAEHEDLRGHR